MWLREGANRRSHGQAGPLTLTDSTGTEQPHGCFSLVAPEILFGAFPVRLKKIVEIAPAKVQPRMLSVKEAAAYLGATVWHVRSLVWAKKLTALRMGHRQVFDRSDLDSFIERLKLAS